MGRRGTGGVEVGEGLSVRVRIREEASSSAESERTTLEEDVMMDEWIGEGEDVGGGWERKKR